MNAMTERLEETRRLAWEDEDSPVKRRAGEHEGEGSGASLRREGVEEIMLAAEVQVVPAVDQSTDLVLHLMGLS